MSKTKSKKYLYIVIGILVVGGFAFGLTQSEFFKGAFPSFTSSQSVTSTTVKTIEEAKTNAALAEEKAATYATTGKTALSDAKSAYSDSDKTALKTAQGEASTAATNARAQASTAEDLVEKATKIYEKHEKKQDEYNDGLDPLEAVSDYIYEQYKDILNEDGDMQAYFLETYETELSYDDCKDENPTNLTVCVDEYTDYADAFDDFCEEISEDLSSGGKVSFCPSDTRWDEDEEKALELFEDTRDIYEDYLDAEEDIEDYEDDNELDFDLSEDAKNLADVEESAENADASADKAEGHASRAASYKILK